MGIMYVRRNERWNMLSSFEKQGAPDYTRMGSCMLFDPARTTCRYRHGAGMHPAVAMLLVTTIMTNGISDNVPTRGVKEGGQAARSGVSGHSLDRQALLLNQGPGAIRPKDQPHNCRKLPPCRQ